MFLDSAVTRSTFVPEPRLDLVARHGRAAREAGDGGVDVELLEDMGERLDDLVVRLAARLVRGAMSQHREVRQVVGDIALERELLDPRRHRRRRRRRQLRL